MLEKNLIYHKASKQVSSYNIRELTSNNSEEEISAVATVNVKATRTNEENPTGSTVPNLSINLTTPFFFLKLQFQQNLILITALTYRFIWKTAKR